MSLSFYFDHNMETAVSDALRDRGIDVLSAIEDDFDRAPDELVLERADALLRVLVTHDRDYLRLAAERLSDGRPFNGVVFCHQSRVTVGMMVSELELVARAMTSDDIRNTVVWIPL